MYYCPARTDEIGTHAYPFYSRLDHVNIGSPSTDNMGTGADFIRAVLQIKFFNQFLNFGKYVSASY
jgi:hypothetical protein